MQQLFGGKIQRQPGRGWLGVVHVPQILQTNDVIAVTNATPKAITIYPEVSRPGGAAAWTALQAYLAKGDVPLTHLRLETDGAPGYREWVTSKGIGFASDIQIAEISYLIADRKAAEQSDQQARRAAEEAFMNDIREPLEWAGSPNFFAIRLDASREAHPPAEWSETTVFHARGNGLIEVANTMAEGYGELASNKDSADTLVAQALGARSLAGLTDAWNWAMAHDTSFEAGRTMLRALTVEDY